MPKRWAAEEDDYSFEQFDDAGPMDHDAKFDSNERGLAEKYRRQGTKGDKRKSSKDDPLKKFGPVVRSFILDNIKVLDYRDVAKLAGIEAEELREAVEKCGVRISDFKVSRWDDIDLGTFLSVSDCARCQVQRRHSAFLVGINDCRKCYALNIRHWIKMGEPIRIVFREAD